MPDVRLITGPVGSNDVGTVEVCKVHQLGESGDMPSQECFTQSSATYCQT